MRRQGLHSTKEKSPDTDMEDKNKQMYYFVQLWNLLRQKKETFTQMYV